MLPQLVGDVVDELCLSVEGRIKYAFDVAAIGKEASAKGTPIPSMWLENPTDSVDWLFRNACGYGGVDSHGDLPLAHPDGTDQRHRAAVEQRPVDEVGGLDRGPGD